MIRISTREADSHTVVVIDGSLSPADLEEVHRVRESLPGGVILDLGGLNACAGDGIKLLRNWLSNGATLDHAAPFLRMVLEGEDGASSLKKN